MLKRLNETPLTPACVEDLPPPPTGRTGWPWNTPWKTFTGDSWPRLSIITVNFNYGRFLEETIRSVLSQGYPNLEYLIFDGGSTDESVAIIEKYSKFLKYWQSGPDGGQTSAINQGIKLISGDLFTWLNSDDRFTEGALQEVGKIRLASGAEVVAGSTLEIRLDTGKRTLYDPSHPRSLQEYLDGDPIVAQPSGFIDVKLLTEGGGLKADLECLMHLDLFLRLLLRKRWDIKWVNTPMTLAEAWGHGESKMDRLESIWKGEKRSILRDNMSLMTLSEKLLVVRTLRRWRNHELVSGVLSTSRQRATDLAALFLRRPDIATDRFFWGAVRRAVISNPSSK